MSGVSMKLGKCKEEKIKIEKQVERLANPEKLQKGHRGKTKAKQVYSVCQKYCHKKQKVQTARTSLASLENVGMEPHSFKLKYENEVIQTKFHEKESDGKGRKQPIEDLVRMIFLMDMHNISDNAYHELAQTQSCLPRACSIFKRRHELNASCKTFTLEGEFEGVYKSLKSHLIQNLFSPSKANLNKEDKVKIKLPGDGTRAGTTKHLIHVTYTIAGEKHVPRIVVTLCWHLFNNVLRQGIVFRKPWKSLLMNLTP